MVALKDVMACRVWHVNDWSTGHACTHAKHQTRHDGSSLACRLAGVAATGKARLADSPMLLFFHGSLVSPPPVFPRLALSALSLLFFRDRTSCYSLNHSISTSLRLQSVNPHHHPSFHAVAVAYSLKSNSCTFLLLLYFPSLHFAAASKMGLP
jgi:hypothetical protein